MGHYKILFLDIDGTILRPDDTIEDSTKTAINEMKRQNIEVVLATGRPLHEISDLAEELQITSFIGYNGALAFMKAKRFLPNQCNLKMYNTYWMLQQLIAMKLFVIRMKKIT
ncbi:hydrolase [Mesobacillus boroniphilus JCM 21738]|uniref:Hydrolase n=1 Tax=Mesobacillus boroniphilus JCM 21738 TaxID=1294265 RepID=W4RKL0_9BACI|nr:hydrolase [Mesobacillus boroniphilus JCM 21738]